MNPKDEEDDLEDVMAVKDWSSKQHGVGSSHGTMKSGRDKGGGRDLATTTTTTLQVASTNV